MLLSTSAACRAALASAATAHASASLPPTYTGHVPDVSGTCPGQQHASASPPPTAASCALSATASSRPHAAAAYVGRVPDVSRTCPVDSFPPARGRRRRRRRLRSRRLRLGRGGGGARRGRLHRRLRLALHRPQLQLAVDCGLLLQQRLGGMRRGRVMMSRRRHAVTRHGGERTPTEKLASPRAPAPAGPRSGERLSTSPDAATAARTPQEQRHLGQPRATSGNLGQPRSTSVNLGQPRATSGNLGQSRVISGSLG